MSFLKTAGLGMLFTSHANAFQRGRGDAGGAPDRAAGSGEGADACVAGRGGHRRDRDPGPRLGPLELPGKPCGPGGNHLVDAA